MRTRSVDEALDKALEAIARKGINAKTKQVLGYLCRRVLRHGSVVVPWQDMTMDALRSGTGLYAKTIEGGLNALAALGTIEWLPDGDDGAKLQKGTIGVLYIPGLTTEPTNECTTNANDDVLNQRLSQRTKGDSKRRNKLTESESAVSAAHDHRALFGAICFACRFDTKLLDTKTQMAVAKLAKTFQQQGVSPEFVRECAEKWYSVKFDWVPRSQVNPPRIGALKTWVGECRRRDEIEAARPLAEY